MDPTTLIENPSTNRSISSHLSAVLKIEESGLSLNEEQRKIVENAIRVLDTGDASLLDEAFEDDLEMEYYFESDSE